MVTENLDINSKHWWVQLTKNHRITFRGLVQKNTFGKCMGLAWKYLHRSALPHQRPTREPLKFRVANLAYHHSATQECGPPGRRHAAAARAQRATTRKGPVPRRRGRPDASPRSPAVPGSAVPPHGRTDGFRPQEPARRPGGGRPARHTSEGPAARVTAREERPRARVRGDPGGPGSRGGRTGRAARRRGRTAPYALQRGG